MYDKNYLKVDPNMVSAIDDGDIGRSFWVKHAYYVSAIRRRYINT